MARPLRIEYQNALYHVTTRGNAREPIFKDDFDRNIFLDVVEKAYNRFGFIIHAFALMGNHYHLLIETPNANLTVSMHHLNCVYTQAFNRRHKSVGHLLQGRYKAFIVEKEAYYLTLIRYIHLNPLKHHFTEDVNQYRYTSHQAIINEQTAKAWSGWFNRDLILIQFGQKTDEALKRYLEFVSAGNCSENPLDNVIGGYFLGSEDFAERLWNEFAAPIKDVEISDIKNRPKGINVEDVIGAVKVACGSNSNEEINLLGGRGSPNTLRDMVLYVLYHYSSMTQKEIGEKMGCIRSSTISAAVRKFERTVERDDRMKRICLRALKFLNFET